MFTRGAVPPSGVKLSWAAMTAPVEVPVVDAANSRRRGRPEPDLLALHVAARLAVAGDLGDVDAEIPHRFVACTSNPVAMATEPAHRTNIAPKTTQPCFWSFAIRP